METFEIRYVVRRPRSLRVTSEAYVASEIPAFQCLLFDQRRPNLIISKSGPSRFGSKFLKGEEVKNFECRHTRTSVSRALLHFSWSCRHKGTFTMRVKCSMEIFTQIAINFQGD